MVNRNPGCPGNYDFDHIAHFSRKRFIDGYSTSGLLEQADSETELKYANKITAPNGHEKQ